jgi:hypothetical protein
MKIAFLLITFLLSMPSLSAADNKSPDQGAVYFVAPDESETPAKPNLRIRVKEGDGPWRTVSGITPVRGDEVRLKIPDRQYDAVRWYLIFPDLTQNYKNANHPWEPEPYKWVGIGKIRYGRAELTALRDKAEVAPFERPGALYDAVRRWLKETGTSSDRGHFYHDELGTFWFQVEATKSSNQYRSPGIGESTRHGLSARVTRVSIRKDASYLGQLTSFYNVPGVFGSVLAQSKKYLGADCADVLMTAWHQWRRRPIKKNYNVQMVVHRFAHLAKTRIDGGTPDQEIRWGETVNPGDFIAVSYGENQKKFHHIGALNEDANQNGILDPADTVLHAGPDPLHLSALGEGAFDGRVVILKSGR